MVRRAYTRSSHSVNFGLGPKFGPGSINPGSLSTEKSGLEEVLAPEVGEPAERRLRFAAAVRFAWLPADSMEDIVELE